MSNEKTWREWFDTLPTGCRQSAVMNFKKYSDQPAAEAALDCAADCESLTHAVRSAFSWDETPEGYRFWAAAVNDVETVNAMADELRREAVDRGLVPDNPNPPPAPREAINPDHYKQHPSGIECIQVTEHMNFNCGNVVKYLWRCGKKDPELQELRKARWYLDREIKRLEEQQDAE